MSVEAQWEPNGGRCIALSQSLASIQVQAVGRGGMGGDPQLSHKKVMHWASQQEELGFNPGTEKIMTSLPPRKIREMQEKLEEWPEGRRTATVWEVFMMAGKVHHICRM